MALLTAVAVGFGLDRLRARPDSRPPAADFYDRGGLQPLALFADALNIASMLLALRAQSKGAPPSERTRD